MDSVNIGQEIIILRGAKGWTQQQLADMLQMAGLDIDKNAVQRIESGKRFVTDIELKVIAEVLGISYDKLLN